jgi:hypothetical protein
MARRFEHRDGTCFVFGNVFNIQLSNENFGIIGLKEWKKVNAHHCPALIVKLLSSK